MKDELGTAYDLSDKDQLQNILNEIDNIIKSFQPRQHIEIEEKYRCSHETLIEVEKWFNSSLVKYDYKLAKSFDEFVQIDVYYDTEEQTLKQNDISLRLRNIGDKKIYTIKKPTNSRTFGESSQFARFEFEWVGETGDINEATDFIKEHLDDILKKSDQNHFNTKDRIDTFLFKVLKVENKRKKAILVRSEHNGLNCEVCLDNVSFYDESDRLVGRDYQIEIELKSDYVFRVALKEFTTLFEKHFKGKLTRESLSKFNKGLNRIKQRQ